MKPLINTILAFDTSSENCSVALYHQGSMDQLLEFSPRNHTKLILPMIQALLDKHHLVLADIQAIAFGCGPGSFTGIRIAAGIAQGLAYGLNIPIYAISNLQALALQHYLEHGISTVLACIDARMGEVYWSAYTITPVMHSDLPTSSLYDVQGLYPEQVNAPEEVVSKILANKTSDVLPEDDLSESVEPAENWTAIGSGLSVIKDHDDLALQGFLFVNTEAQPRSEAIVHLARMAILRGETGSLADALPAYVRDSVTWNKLPGR